MLKKSWNTLWITDILFLYLIVNLLPLPFLEMDFLSLPGIPKFQSQNFLFRLIPTEICADLHSLNSFVLKIFPGRIARALNMCGPSFTLPTLLSLDTSSCYLTERYFAGGSVLRSRFLPLTWGPSLFCVLFILLLSEFCWVSSTYIFYPSSLLWVNAALVSLSCNLCFALIRNLRFKDKSVHSCGVAKTDNWTF